MKEYLISATAVIFLSVIVSLIIPEGKLHKTILFVMRMVCILVLIQPISGIFKINSQATDMPTYDYNYICKVYSEDQSRQLQEVIYENFDVECECLVDIEYKEGDFVVDGVRVEIKEDDSQTIEKIYEYLEQLKYINISVYTKSD